MIYRPKKNQVYCIIIVIILCILLEIIHIIKYNPTRIRIKRFGYGFSVLGAGTFALITAIRDLKASIYVDNEILHYKRAGQYVKVRWEDIGRIEYSNHLKFVKGLDCMKIYTGSADLYIDYTVENYLELWEYIIDHYKKFAEDPNIDPKLCEMLAKRQERQRKK
ncbi:MAG: hypothetical protein IKL36_00420 [Clostridia bacterium]|nr:hypothetical protein [Clostridia bacterium]